MDETKNKESCARLEFGVALESFTPPSREPSIDSIYEMSSLAESLGFDSVWVWDHIFLGSRRVFPILDSLTTLAAIGARTSRVELGTSVLILSLRNPIVASKAISTLHYLTGGRLVLGVSVGWYEREFRAIGVDFTKRGKTFERNFDLVRKLISDSDVNYQSEGTELKHASMEPRFVKPPPMLIGGYSEAVLKRAGRISDGWISYYYTPEDFASSWRVVLESARANGRDAGKLTPVAIVPIAIAGSREEGKRMVAEFTSSYMDLPKNTRCTVDSAVSGTVRDCLEQARAFESAGVQHLVFIPCNYDARQVESVGREIISEFRKG